MNHYEKGCHTPDYPTLQRIAKVLKVPTAYFYAETDELAKFINVFNRANKSTKRFITNELDPEYTAL